MICDLDFQIHSCWDGNRRGVMGGRGEEKSQGVCFEPGPI